MGFFFKNCQNLFSHLSLCLLFFPENLFVCLFLELLRRYIYMTHSHKWGLGSLGILRAKKWGAITIYVLHLTPPFNWPEFVCLLRYKLDLNMKWNCILCTVIVSNYTNISKVVKVTEDSFCWSESYHVLRLKNDFTPEWQTWLFSEWDYFSVSSQHHQLYPSITSSFSLCCIFEKTIVSEMFQV